MHRKTDTRCTHMHTIKTAPPPYKIHIVKGQVYIKKTLPGRTMSTTTSSGPSARSDGDIEGLPEGVGVGVVAVVWVVVVSRESWK